MKNFAKKCACGAITVFYENEDGQKVNSSMPEDLFNANFPEIEIEEQVFCNCNYCANNWGVDLCSCGSGEKVGECQEGFYECVNNIPAQTLGEIKTYSLWN